MRLLNSTEKRTEKPNMPLPCASQLQLLPLGGWVASLSLPLFTYFHTISLMLPFHHPGLQERRSAGEVLSHRREGNGIPLSLGWMMGALTRWQKGSRRGRVLLLGWLAGKNGA